MPLFQRLSFNSTAINLLFSSHFGSHSVGKPKSRHVTEKQSGNVAGLFTQRKRASAANVSERTQRTTDRVAKASPEKIQRVLFMVSWPL
jgi:hypothetical protein